MCTYIVVFDADVLLGFKCKVSKLKQCGIEAKTGQLEDFLESKRKVLGLHVA